MRCKKVVLFVVIVMAKAGYVAFIAMEMGGFWIPEDTEKGAFIANIRGLFSYKK